MIHHIRGWYMTAADLLPPKPVLSQVLAPADMAVWNRVGAEVEKLFQRPPHVCSDACRPYSGPILQGRPGETITPGRTT